MTKCAVSFPVYSTSELSSEEAMINLSRHEPSVSPDYLHYHTQLEIGLCLRGSGVFYIHHNVYPFVAGDISFIFPGEHHIAQSAQHELSEWYFFAVDIPSIFRSHPDSENIKRLSQGRAGQGHILNSMENQQILFFLNRLISLCNEKKDHLHEIFPQISALIACILYETEEWKRNETTDNTRLKHYSSERLSVIFPAIQYMLLHYSDAISTDQLCKCCNVSPVHLRRLFADTLGVSPLSFLQKIRVSHAGTELIETELPIIAISEGCGYQSLSSFNRQFHKYMGISPSAYRASLKMKKNDPLQANASGI